MLINNPKGVGKRMVMDRHKFKVPEVQNGRQAQGQGRQNGQAGRNGVQKNRGFSKPGGQVKE
jgi:hypothetical protein